ncbi:hypothetical protein SDC9_23508 [bioreactor metagenome]|jgi:hypothetical protein|uniref:Uncharacterized protein n=1 Tax=bioreactor metagenome TaxID=1076179 RepID=A0A644UFI1_9ZZZZ
MDKKSLQKIKSKLPRNYAKLIREKTGKSYSSIFKTFQESSPLYVSEVVEAALLIIEEHQAKEEKLKKKIADLC